MITLQINGKQVELKRPTPLLAYIETLGVDPRAVAVEHNGTILERAAYETITLNEGDSVEIVRMVGGGHSANPVVPTRPRLLRAARIAVLVQAVALLVVIGLAIPSYLDFLFRPLNCRPDQWCLDFRGLTLGLTAVSMGPPAFLLLTTYWLWRRPRRWAAAIPLLVDVTILGMEVVYPRLIAEAMSFSYSGRTMEATFVASLVGVQVLLLLIPAVASLTLVLALIRRWGSSKSTRGTFSSTP
jgi:thiamine biosynthesis protein ThiS